MYKCHSDLTSHDGVETSALRNPGRKTLLPLPSNEILTYNISAKTFYESRRRFLVVPQAGTPRIDNFSVSLEC